VQSSQPESDLRELLLERFRHLTEEELLDIEEALISYMEIIVEIYESAMADPARRAQLKALTSPASDRRINCDSVSNN